MLLVRLISPLKGKILIFFQSRILLGSISMLCSTHMPTNFIIEAFIFNFAKRKQNRGSCNCQNAKTAVKCVRSILLTDF